MKSKITTIKILAISVLLPGAIFSEQTDFELSQQSLPWLAQESQVVSAGKAGVTGGSRGSAEAATTHPAGLASMDSHHLVFSHAQGFQGQTTEHMAYGLSLGKNRGAAVVVDYLNFGTVPTYTFDPTINPASGTLIRGGDLNPYGLSAALGVGQAFGSFSIGATAKYVSEDLGVVHESGFAGDFGVAWNSRRLNVSVSGLNIGGKIYGQDLPMTVRTGVSSTFRVSADNDLQLGLETMIPLAAASAASTGLGLEFGKAGVAGLRIGYRFGSKEALQGFTLGAGATFGHWQTDFAVEDFGSLGTSYRLALGLKI
jgi:hypothetical protein